MNDRPTVLSEEGAFASGENSAASSNPPEVQKRSDGRAMLSIHVHDYLEEAEL